MRRAFSMVTAIFVIVLMATVSMLILRLAGQSSKVATIQYRQEQAAFLARSYTELAVMAIADHNRSSNNRCIQYITGDVNNIIPGASIPAGVNSRGGGGYRVDVYISYLGNNLPCSSNNILNSAAIVTDYNTTTPARSDSVAGAIVDVFVRYKDPAMVGAYQKAHGGTLPTTTQIPWITYHKRTLQKI